MRRKGGKQLLRISTCGGSGLNFVAALLLSASYRCEREFVPQSIFTYLIPCNSPKGIVFSAYIDDMIKEYEDKRLKIEESIPVFLII